MVTAPHGLCYAYNIDMERRFLSLFLALAVLSAQALAGGFAFACQMDGEIHRSCCCQSEASGSVTGPQSSESDCGCCDVEVLEPIAAALAPSVVVDAPPTFAPAVLPAHHVSRSPLRPTSLRVRPDSTGEARRTPPLFLLNASFLI